MQSHHAEGPAARQSRRVLTAKRIAMHEAAHAVAAIALGLDVEEVRCGSSPVCVTIFQPGQEWPAVVSLLAGWAIERQAYGAEPHSDDLLRIWLDDARSGRRDDDDALAFALLLSIAPDSDHLAAYRVAEAEASALVAQAAEWIGVVADMLLTSGSASGRQVREAMSRGFLHA